MSTNRANCIALITTGLFAATLLPSGLANMRETSRRIQCADNLRKITLGIDQYVSAGEYYPPAITRIPRNHGWLASVLPFVERADIYEKYDFSAHWCDPVNAAAIETRVPMFECPSANYIGRIAVGETQFPYRGAVLDYLATNRVSPVMVTDGWLPKSTRIDGILTRQRLIHRSEVRDGLSNTILLAEVAGTPAKYVFRAKEPRPMYGERGFGGWADAGIYIQGHGHQPDGRDWPGHCVINCTNDDAIYSFHRGGANVSFGDGAVRFVIKQVDLYILRSMTSGEGDHDRATHFLRTGYKPVGAIRFPSLGSLIASESVGPEKSLPPFIGIASTPQLAALGNGFLPQQFAPLAVVPTNNNRDLTIPGLSPGSIQNTAQIERQKLLDRFDSMYLSDRTGVIAKSVQNARKQALRLQDPSVAQVFDLSNTSNDERERYGNSIFAQGCLLARRLVEKHVPCIEVTLPGWDAHRNNFETVKNLSAQLDRALSALIDDLSDRDLLANTLLICHGEFGRTPHINGNFGRDHFPNAWSVLMAGGNCCDGKVIGRTSIDGMEVDDRPIKIPDLIASVCHWAGVDYRKQNMSSVQRPIRIADIEAQVIGELFS